jgi:hypothetical protein
VGLSARNYPVVSSGHEAIEILVPYQGGPTTALVHLIGELERSSFRGGMVALREWNSGSPGLDEIGQRIISLLLGDRNDLDSNSPLAVIFAPSEALSVQAFLLHAMLFGWDAFYVPDSAAFMIFISHDEVMYLIPNGYTFTEVISDQLRHFGARSVPPPEMLVRPSTGVEG